MVVPGSRMVKRQAEAEGLDKIFLDAGMEWRRGRLQHVSGDEPRQTGAGRALARRRATAISRAARARAAGLTSSRPRWPRPPRWPVFRGHPRVEVPVVRPRKAEFNIQANQPEDWERPCDPSPSIPDWSCRWTGRTWTRTRSSRSSFEADRALTGFGQFAFFDWRLSARQLPARLRVEQAEYRGAGILLARPLRLRLEPEHAPGRWKTMGSA